MTDEYRSWITQERAGLTLPQVLGLLALPIIPAIIMCIVAVVMMGR